MQYKDYKLTIRIKRVDAEHTKVIQTLVDLGTERLNKEFPSSAGSVDLGWTEVPEIQH